LGPPVGGNPPAVEVGHLLLGVRSATDAIQRAGAGGVAKSLKWGRQRGRSRRPLPVAPTSQGGNATDAITTVKAWSGFATDRGLSIAAWYVENESGAKLSRRSCFDC
jgi:hypothetical protein